ncbi:MAG: helix-turn-helix domain-containing protein [Oscillospiraceae bacterium]
MTDMQFHSLFGEALNDTDRDAFVSDWALSSIWGDEPDAEIPEDRLDQIGAIWDAAHRSVREIAALASLSQRKLAERFCVPYRTVEDWCRGLRTPPDYVRLMMQECLGLIDRQ